MGALLTAAREVRDEGTFGFLDRAPGTPELDRLLNVPAPAGDPRVRRADAPLPKEGTT